ncbi:MAG: dihydropyrimidine dehydrogenase subunit PreA [Thermoanaerobacteraceae bacterium]|nr:dihydropyrimidine dehydrogenase subunit PreA [Thermoanaerobacteraceae bacterium]
MLQVIGPYGLKKAPRLAGGWLLYNYIITKLKGGKTMSASLKLNFAGIDFINPFILSSAPPTNSREMIERAFEEGWAGAIIKTLAYDLKQTQNVNPRISAVKHNNMIIGFTNCELGSTKSVDVWLEDIVKIKKNYPQNVLMASLLHTEGLVEKQWKEVAKKCEEAGVDGFELNFSCSHGMAESGGGSSIGENEDLIKKVISWVKDTTCLPVMVKFNAMVSNISQKVLVAKESGADAVSGINTIRSLNGIDIYNFIPYPQVDGESCFSGYSGAAIKPIGLRFVAQIAKDVNIPISGIGGITNWKDAAEYILVGASTLQVCSAVMYNGYKIIKSLTQGLQKYMDKMGFNEIKDFVGLALPKIKRHNDLNRNYKLVSTVDLDNCNGCGMCSIACRDSGYQAITMSDSNKPIISEDKCDGCGLCHSICPKDCIMLIRRKMRNDVM